jgi:hypothetical protein
MPLPSMSNSVSSVSEPVWVVPLSDHASYDHVRLKRVFTTDGTRHEVVLIDVRKLMLCADRDDTDYVLRPVHEWHMGKVRGIREFLDPDNARVPEMPYVTISARRSPGLLGWFALEHEGVVAFRNGQHRARYLAAASVLRRAGRRPHGAAAEHDHLQRVCCLSTRNRRGARRAPSRSR